MKSVTIASIYFAPVAAERPLFRDTNIWGFKAVPRGAAPELLRVVDGYQMERQPITHHEIKHTILASEIANDLVREWTTNAPGMTADAKPGIWVCEGDAPTEAETAEARRKQAAWAEALILQGDAKHEDPKTKGEITPLMRAACRWMGSEREWLVELKDNEIKVCPFCTKSVRAQAVKCQHCGEIVDVKRYAAMMAERDSAVKSAAAPMPLPPPIQAPSQPRAAR